MITRAELKVKFNHKVPANVITTPGSYSFIKKNGEEVTFDFVITETYISRKNMKTRTFVVRIPDTESFPEMADITAEDFLSMQGFTDIFIDLDEAEEDIHVEDIIYFDIEMEEPDGAISKIKISKDILKAYKEVALCA